MQIELPPSVPYEKRLDSFKNAIANQIEYASKNQTWTDLGQGGKGQVGSLSVDVEGMASKYGVKPDDAEKIYRQIKNKSSLTDAFTKGADELKSLASKKTDLPSDYAKLAKKYGGKTSDWVNESSKYLENFPKATKQTSGIAKAIEASKERSARGLEKNLVSSTAGKAAPMETPYGKSFLSYTPEGKIAGKAGSVLRGLGRVAGPLGAALTALDFAQAAGEIQEKGAAKIAEDYKKSKMAESEAEILTPEADKFREGLKSKRTELEILRAELERKREEEEKYKERERRGLERRARVRDTLEKTGLLP